ncbi:hypothetical protein [Pseudomaricurvus sp. HS19]|uniref:hypothetical protein n=1 Tax=Pseudomaricurvus sp. HS19 TaxID=2692626 RepID=UPI001370B097|nr:hypothetical protein [Pseudomaricurvus sp. HS19]MYM64193.1 hypothetical protein [Pseudomaricurvus sp. HS19]
MKKLLLSLIIVALSGCSGPSIYEQVANDMNGAELIDKVWLVGIDWIPSGKEINYQLSAEDRDLAKSALNSCVGELTEEAGNELQQPNTKRLSVATIQLTLCMQRKQWEPSVSSAILTR